MCERNSWAMGGRRAGLGMEGRLRAALTVQGHSTNEWMQQGRTERAWRLVWSCLSKQPECRQSLEWYSPVRKVWRSPAPDVSLAIHQIVS